MGCSSSTDVADPSLQQGATQAGTVHESDKLPGEGLNPERMLQTSLDVVNRKQQICVKTLWSIIQSWNALRDNKKFICTAYHKLRIQKLSSAESCAEVL